MADKANVLHSIVEHKRQEVATKKSLFDISDLKQVVEPSTRSLKNALAKSGNRFILEYKRASPSKGDIRPEFTVSDLLTAYEPCADAYSVLTDKHYFYGSHFLLKSVSDKTNKPVLCKDFFIEEYQIYEARFYGADAVLLMLSVLSDEDYRRLAQVAKVLSMDVLTEVHTEEECCRAVALGAEIIGINNRNLKTLKTDLENTPLLRRLLPNDAIVISESGITSRDDIDRLSSEVDGFLVGSSLMASHNVALAAKKLVYGVHKICGVKSATVAKRCFNSGASYIGLMFYPQSKRYISPEEAQHIVHKAPGHYVGVFVNASIEDILCTQQQCHLTAIQLHGYETEAYISKLKQELPQSVQVWKALPMNSRDGYPTVNRFLKVADKVVIDSEVKQQFGGSGRAFDWDLIDELLQKVDEEDVVIAGGINVSNIQSLLPYSNAIFDLSSGVETLPGEKDVKLIEQYFEQCRLNGK